VPNTIPLEVRVLLRAIELLGGERQVAQHLKIARHDLRMLLDGTERPTRGLFLALVDILIDHDGEASVEDIISRPSSADMSGAAVDRKRT
jgi:hypothetical protein